MTETLSRGAANQAGARIDTDAYAKAADFLPLNGIDHVEFWVGNARQAAAYYRALWGFTPGRVQRPRDQGPRPGQLRHGPERHPVRVHGAADPRRRDRRARSGARRRRPRHRLRGRRRRVGLARDDDPRARSRRSRRRSSMAARTASCARPRSAPTARSCTRSSTGATTPAPSRPGYRKVKSPARAAEGLSLLEVDHCVGNVGLGRDGPVRRLLPRRPGLRPAHPLRRQGHPHRLQRADVEGHDQRQRPHQVPDQRAGDRQEEEPDPGVPRLVSLARLPAHRAADRGHRRRPSAGCATTASSSWACRTSTTRRSRIASATSACRSTRSRSSASRPTATRRATSSRSSRDPSRTARRSSSRSSSATARAASASATSRPSSRRSNASRRSAGTSSRGEARPRPGATRPGRGAVAARAALDASATRWVDLEIARRRAVAGRPALAHDSALHRQPITTLDDHLARGLRVEALTELVEAFEPRGDPDGDDAVLDAGDLAVRSADPAAAVVARLLRLRAPRPDDVGASRRRGPRGVVPPADLLLLEHLGDPWPGGPGLGAGRLAGARLRARGGRAHRHARARPLGRTGPRRRSAATSC